VCVSLLPPPDYMMAIAAALILLELVCFLLNVCFFLLLPPGYMMWAWSADAPWRSDDDKFNMYIVSHYHSCSFILIHHQASFPVIH
jgi:hypothetical protein